MTLQFAFKVTYGGLDSVIYVAGGRDDLEAEEAVEAALEADGEDPDEIELLGEATEEQMNDRRTLFVAER
jgi:hypothetical protein